MDFITDLQMSNCHNAILVVIDRLTKMSHFIPCRKDPKIKQFADLFLKEIVRLYGIPQDIITDRGSILSSDQWKKITKNLGIQQKFSTAFHQQTERQIEKTNSILEQYI